jgi:hypothetical protein
MGCPSMNAASRKFRGSISTACLFVHSGKSGLLYGCAEDAAFIANRIAEVELKVSA